MHIGSERGAFHRVRLKMHSFRNIYIILYGTCSKYAGFQIYAKQGRHCWFSPTTFYYWETFQWVPFTKRKKCLGTLLENPGAGFYNHLSIFRAEESWPWIIFKQVSNFNCKGTYSDRKCNCIPFFSGRKF